MREIIVGFSSPRSFKPGAELIKLWQGGTTYSHIYLKMYLKKYNRFMVYECSHGSVRCLEAFNWARQNKITKEFTCQISEEKLDKTVATCIDLLAKPYGYFGLLKLVLAKICKKLFRSRWLSSWGDGMRTFHCSEFIARLLPEAVEYTTEKNPDHLEPVDIFPIMPLLQLRYREEACR